MKAFVIRHVSFEKLGTIGSYLQHRNINYTETIQMETQKLPETLDFDLLVIMGGPMNIFDDLKFPWLVEERAFIRKAFLAKKKIIGICLGAQLLADCLGAKVYKGPFKEIGWHSVLFTKEYKKWYGEDSSIETKVLQWHQDTFDIPANCLKIGQSKEGINQGFIYQEQVLALQYHLEMTKETIWELIENGREELMDQTINRTYIQSEKDILNEDLFFEKNNQILESTLDRFLKLQENQ